jgi:RNA polymerase primary sigma factor
VAHLARRIPREGTLLSRADLVQEGAVGLATAAERYDPAHGVRFGAFARWYVIDALRAAAARSRQGVRLSVPAHRRLRTMQRGERRLTAGLGRTPAARELAHSLGWSERDVHELRRVAAGPVSLDAPLGDDEGRVVADLLVAPQEDPATEPEIDKASLRAAVGELPPAERQVVHLRYGLDGEPPRTAAEVARELRAGERRVASIEAQALRRLRATTAF